MFQIILFSTSIFAGFLGALLGLGGGIIIVPVLTLILGVNIRYAIAASLIAIVATSSGAAASFLKDHLTNLRLAVLLEVGTVTGAMVGFFITGHIQTHYLFILFGSFLMLSAFMMLKKKGDSITDINHPWAEKLNLGSKFPDGKGGLIFYKVAAVPLGLFIMFLAGILSALLGIGSGIFKVMAMDGLMKIPMKVSSATSNFMIGVTATASAGAFLLKGDILPEIACPVSVGIIIGSWVGAKVMPRMPANTIRRIFVIVLMIVSVQMMMKGFKV